MSTILLNLVMIVTAFMMFYLPFNLFFPNAFNPKKICLTCGHKGKTKKQAKEIIQKLQISQDNLDKPSIKLTFKLLKLIEERLDFI